MWAPGFIDLHCHLLPGLDDGPQTPQAAEDMCALAYRSGTVAVVATPHASHRYRFDAAQAHRQRAALQSRLGFPLRLLGGSEVELSVEVLLAALDAPQSYTLNGSRYLLVELLPAALAPLDRLLGRLLERGLTPILAHPERHAQLLAHPHRLAQWVEHGGLVQITADSLAGRAGRRLQTAALRLLAWGLVHFVASDAHDPIRRPPRLLDAYHVVCEAAGPQCADRLFIDNPRAVVEDQALDCGA